MKVYNLSNTYNRPDKKLPIINVNRNNQVVISKHLMNSIGLKAGDKINICQSETDELDFFISKTDDEFGIVLKERKSGCLFFSNKVICSLLRIAAKATGKNVSLKVITAGHVEDGVTYYLIVTTKPIFKK